MSKYYNINQLNKLRNRKIHITIKRKDNWLESMTYKELEKILSLIELIKTIERQKKDFKITLDREDILIIKDLIDKKLDYIKERNI